MLNVTSCCKNCQRYLVLCILQQAPTLEIAMLPDISHDVVKMVLLYGSEHFTTLGYFLAELSKIIRI